MAEASAVAAVLNRESDPAAVKAWAMQMADVKEKHAAILEKNEVTPSPGHCCGYPV